MRLRLITPPAAVPVSVDEARAHVSAYGSGDDAILTAMIAAAVSHLDGRAGVLGRALIQQTWELSLDHFPDTDHRLWPAACYHWPVTHLHAQDVGAIKLPLAPLSSVTWIKYVDETGTQQTLDPATYIVDTTSEPGVVVPAYNALWPVTQKVRNAVTVRFVCGYGTNATDVPQALRSAILLMVGDLFENREAVTGDARAAYVDNPTVARLIAPFRMLTL
jgi:uncharacterized phiE125 gp8 family phage protein